MIQAELPFQLNNLALMPPQNQKANLSILELENSGMRFAHHDSKTLVFLDRFIPSNCFTSLQKIGELLDFSLCISVLNPLAAQIYFSLPETIKNSATFYCPYFSTHSIERRAYYYLLNDKGIFSSRLRNGELSYSGVLLFNHVHLPGCQVLDQNIVYAIENLKPLGPSKEWKPKTVVGLLGSTNISTVIFMLKSNQSKYIKELFIHLSSDVFSFVHSAYWKANESYNRNIYFPIKGLADQTHGKVLVRGYWILHKVFNTLKNPIVDALSKIRWALRGLLINVYSIALWKIISPLYWNVLKPLYSKGANPLFWKVASPLFWSFFRFITASFGLLRKYAVLTFWGVYKFVSPVYWRAFRFIVGLNGLVKKGLVIGYWKCHRAVSHTYSYAVRIYWSLYHRAYVAVGEIQFLLGKTRGMSIRLYWNRVVPLSRLMLFPLYKLFYFTKYQYETRILKLFKTSSSSVIDEEV